MKHIAIYPGTFDPITYGHEDIVRRAAALFDKVIVAVAVSERKSPLFTFEQRLQLAKQVFAPFANVEVQRFSGLTVTFAREQKAQVVIRGIRTLTDIEYELQLASMNRAMAPEIETLFLTSAEKFAYISSTIVREIGLIRGDISPFVPKPVVAAFKKFIAK